MSTITHVAHVPQLDDQAVRDNGLQHLIDHAAATKSPPPSWYRTMGQNPEVAQAFSQYWDLLHRGGRVEHTIKELCRIQIAMMIGCEFCSRQVSPAADIDETTKMSCALPDWEHPDPRTRAAMHYARTLTLGDGRDAEVYAELAEHFDHAEVVELATFFTLTAGGNRMAKSWDIEPETGNVIPEGVMSVAKAGSRS